MRRVFHIFNPVRARPFWQMGQSHPKSMALKVVQLSGQTVAADLKGVQSVSELRQRVGAAVGEAPARIRLLAGEIEVMDSSDFVPAAFPSGVVTMAISAPGLQAGFYYLDDCEAFNYDSDVDGGEDEIEILEDGSAKRLGSGTLSPFFGFWVPLSISLLGIIIFVYVKPKRILKVICLLRF